ncbi:DUF397 domain-containing protein [Streptomyces paludis]|uniref:DUF397 domain-containing protein n=1 Tax=Streptomyces paludis TaxID=2282738 RepID=A0A345HP13_9ACTN|nr:DUF397 domain-containing protein [Streptomyces paludis]AXG78437.1 DUF397 domain-containing protein [Streptomyces paludis]
MTSEAVGPYRKSSYSGQQGNCVEVAITDDGGCAVRDSKDQARRPLGFARAQWQIFLAHAKSEAC